MKTLLSLCITTILLLMLSSCNSGKNNSSEQQHDSLVLAEDTIGENLLTTDSTAIIANDTAKKVSPQAKTNKTKVLVYYFHGTHRCPSCLAIEAATKKTLETHFKTQLSEKSIRFRTINVDEEANKEIAEKYEAYGASLFLTQIRNGKEKRVNLTGEGFKFALNNEAKFIEILKTKIEELLKEE